MSILETFYILFKSDSKDVKKGAKDAEKAAKELNKTLEQTDAKSEKVGQSFLNMSNSALKAFASIASVGGVFASLRNTIQGVNELGQVSRLLNVNAEDLDAWGNAVQRTGGNAKQFQSTLSSLSKTLNTTPSVALKALPSIAEALGKMNQAQADLFGRSLGIDQSTIRFLQHGRREVDYLIKKQKELGLITAQDTEITKKFNDAVFDLGRVFNDLSRRIALPTLPLITSTFQYLIEHKDLIKGAFIAIGAGVTVLATSLARAHPYLVAFTAAITAFSLAYEDYKKFMSGDKSVLGLVADPGKTVGTVVNKAVKSRLDSAFGSMLNRPGQPSPDTGFSLKKFFSALTFGKSASNNTTVTIGDVTIQTQATNGEEIAQTFTNELMQQLTQANSNFDNGVTI